MKKLNGLSKVMYIYFILLPFIDVITSIFVRYNISMFTPGMIIKGVTIIYTLYYIFFKTKVKIKKKLVYYLLSLVGFGILYFITKPIILTNIFPEIKYALRFFYYPIIFIGVYCIYKDNNIDKLLIKRLLVINALIYSLLIIIPYFTGLGYNSYGNNSFLGSVGFFYAANEIGAIMSTLGISIYILLEKNNCKSVLLSLLIIFAASIIGTKVSAFGIIISTILSIIFYLLKEKSIKSIIYSSIIIMSLVGFIFISPIKHNYKSLEDMHESSVNESERKEEDKIYKYRSIYDVFTNKKIASFIRTITNSRDEPLCKNYSIFLTSNSTDKLFGLGWTDRAEINYITSRKLIEIDIFDILFHYGIIGFILYFVILFYVFLLVIKRFTSLTKESILYLLFIMLLIGISLMAGHVFSSPSVTIYLVLFIILFINEMNFKVKKYE